MFTTGQHQIRPLRVQPLVIADSRLTRRKRATIEILLPRSDITSVGGGAKWGEKSVYYFWPCFASSTPAPNRSIPGEVVRKRMVSHPPRSQEGGGRTIEQCVAQPPSLSAIVASDRKSNMH
ncbi:hypothetical protein CDAR_571531 [Caerostris darwini]|uniref:Uncharacterized protein n=1 Tax=Caerostris darwini TaxID=1538125 RepID=A0AAV4WF38_9ARAC|nr:hypothetical protein CDAR_571531 [Caerostris darwini]